MNRFDQKALGVALGKWEERSKLGKREAALRLLSKRSVFEECFHLLDPKMHGEEFYDGLTIRGGLSFNESQEESWKRLLVDLEVEADDAVELEKVLFLKALLPEKEGVSNDIEILLYYRGIPLRAGWMNAEVDEECNYKSLSCYQVIDGMVRDAGWEAADADEGEWEEIEQRKQLFDILEEKADSFLYLVYDALVARNGRNR